MSQVKSKIIGLMIFLITVSGISFVALRPAKKVESNQIKSIILSGNHLLPQSSYLSFAKLNDIQNSVELTLPILRNRLEKHPFIASTEIEISKFDNAKAIIHEKNLIAIVICNDQTFLMSDELQLLPMFSSTKFIDMPIINNPKYYKKYRALDYIRNEEMIEAYNIIYAIKTINDTMFKNLSEINLNKGEDITLTFSGVHPIVKFGKGSISKKTLSLNSIWNEFKNADNDLSRSDYVDLRFTNQIYLGKAEVTEL